MINVNENGQTHVKLGYGDVWIGAVAKQDTYVLCFERAEKRVKPGTVNYDCNINLEDQAVIIDFSEADVDALNQVIEDLTVMRNIKKMRQEEVDYNF